MKSYILYNEITGAVTQTGTCSDWMMPIGTNVFEVPTLSTNHWIDITTTPHTLMAKIAHPLTIGSTEIEADGVDECVITGIHNPSAVTWPDGVIETVTDGEVRFSVDLVGEYSLTIEAIPYLKETINVSAVTPA